MRMKMRENEQSFVFGVSVSDYNFIGRKEEIRRLKMNFCVASCQDIMMILEKLLLGRNSN